MSWDSIAVRARPVARLRVARPELGALLGVTAVLNLWGLSINGWANTYYSAAVHSMTLSWHNFLFASLDPSGLMTVDKPPLSLWVQALSARVFGWSSLSLLIPQALMGVAAVWFVYDLVRRRFGRFAGFVAGFALATTPVIVGVSRHNNPDELLVLCSVAAVWAALRAIESKRLRWLVVSGVCVGLGFETKMAVALMVVPGIVAMWLWLARSQRLRGLIAFASPAAVVGLAWPVLVWLTPAADRPWISGTSDNSIWSLIFGYNGLGRIAGQGGGPAGGGGPGGGGFGGGGGSLFGGSTGPFRLLNSALGGQGGWLLGFALVAGIGLLVITRLRRGDERTGWLIAVGGAALTTAVAFSFASGIFHPYYVSLLAPFVAALIGAGVATRERWLAPLAIAGGAVTELVVLGEMGGQLSWAVPLVVVVGAGCAVALGTRIGGRVRIVVISVALAALMAAPATWAAETLGHATNGTFPAGGPASAMSDGPGGGFGRGGGGGFGPPGGFGGAPPGAPPGAVSGARPGQAGSPAQLGAGPGGGFGRNDASVTAAVAYAKSHGGGTVGVSSQSSAASAILSSDANVAGLGGFSGRESSVSASWLAGEIKSGRLRWVVVGTGQGFGLAGDTRTGSQAAMSVVAKVCRKVTNVNATLCDCQGKAAQVSAAATVK